MIMSLPAHIARNYDQFVAAGERTYEQIANQADKDNSPTLAAWARARASEAGVDVTPDNAEPTEKPYAKRTVAELAELVKERGVESKSGWLKNDFVEALETFDAAAVPADPADDEGDYADVSDEDLRDLAKLRELDDSGERAELVVRLKEADAAEANK
jgi:hypothetical protein